MIDHLLEENKLVLEFDQYGLQETDRTFIKEMIAGKPLHVLYIYTCLVDIMFHIIA